MSRAPQSDRDPIDALHATTDERSLCPTLFDALDALDADRRAGRLRSLADYLSRFPDVELSLAKAYVETVERLGASVGKDPASSANFAATSSLKSAVESTSPAPAPKQRYVRRREIGRGGSSVVYKARDGDLDRDVAIKVHTAKSRRSLRRFVFEARLISRLEHPGIPAVHEIGVDEAGLTFFAMHLVRGIDLRRAIESARRGSGGWSTERVLDILAQVCDALGYAHSRGVVHCDVKPANVMIDELDRAHVVDWGLAHVAENRDFAQGHTTVSYRGDLDFADASAGLTREGEIVGTPAYMAPEQMNGCASQIGPALDVYGVGAMLYELLTGRPPHSRDASSRAEPEGDATRRYIAPTAILTLAPDADSDLVALCNRALSFAPHARQASMTELAAELRAHRGGRAVIALAVGAE